MSWVLWASRVVWVRGVWRLTADCVRDVTENCANTGVPILAPNVSRTCGVCGMKCLNSEELLNIAPQFRDLIEEEISLELCGGCGGKFTS